MNPLHLHKISSEDLQKIFPQEYYKKYANHLKILEFEKLIIQEQGRKTSLNFKSRHDNEQRRIKSALPKQQLKRIKISKYDTFQDAINKNKDQLRRMAQYNATLAVKLKLSPQKRNVIRSPIKNNDQIEDSIIMKMIAAEDIQFEKIQKKNRQLKRLLDKNSSCKFIKKSKSSHATPRKINLFDVSQTNPEKQPKTQRKIIQNLGDIVKQSLEKNQSLKIKIQKNQSKVFDSNSSFYIQNINSAIKKTHNILKNTGINYRQEDKIVKMMKKRVMSNSIGLQQNKNQKKDLVQQTRKIKEQVNSMATLKQYDIILQKKITKQNLKNL